VPDVPPPVPEVPPEFDGLAPPLVGPELEAPAPLTPPLDAELPEDDADAPDVVLVVVVDVFVGVVVGLEAVAVGTVSGGAPDVSAEVAPPPPHAASAAESATQAPAQTSLAAHRRGMAMLGPGLKSRAGPFVCRSAGSR
jgi:hypothetical protein